MLTSCGWIVHDIQQIVSVRRCPAEELWRWLWGSLPLLRTGGTFVEGDERAELEPDVRKAFFVRADRFRDGEAFTIRSLAHLAIAIASAAPTTANTTEGPA